MQSLRLVLTFPLRLQSVHRDDSIDSLSSYASVLDADRSDLELTFRDAQTFPLTHKCEILFRSSDLISSMTTAAADMFRARSFSSRLRYRRIEPKSSTMLSNLSTAFAPIDRRSSSRKDMRRGEPGL